MILNDNEYENTKIKIEESWTQLEVEERALQNEGLSQDMIDRLQQPAKSFIHSLSCECRIYRDLKDKIEDILLNDYNFYSLHEVGAWLSKCRIYLGVTQEQLAKHLNVTEKQIQYDERSEYRHYSLGQLIKVRDYLKGFEDETIEN